MTKTLDTLVDDIYSLFDKGGHIVDQKNLDIALANMGESIKKALLESNVPRQPQLRMSSIGTKNRKLWFIHNLPADKQEKINGPTAIKFMYGHILEELLLFLAKESGHEVTGQQDTLSIDGVEGHRDCKIDGVTVDVKSASKWSFQKFEKGTLFKDDPFGYIAQISAYIQADGDKKGAFLAINKETGEIVVLMVEQIDTINAKCRIEEVKQVVNLPEPPREKCYEPKPYGASGNLVLDNNCGYCKFKDLCWKDANGGKGIRRFKYANKIEEFVEITKEPKVDEVPSSMAN